LLAITATDTAPLCGIYSKACIRKYGGTPLRSEFCHEVGLRIMIGTAVREALKYDFGTEVLLSYSADHYLRAYLRCSLGAKRGDSSASSMGYIFHCPSCGWRCALQLNDPWPCSCAACGKPIKRGGPLWCGRLCEREFMERMLAEDRSFLNTGKRIEKLLNLLISESDKPPTYYVLDNICSRLKRDVPPISKIIETLTSMGYESSLTHFHPKAIKTSAPLDVLTKVVKDAGRHPE
jgi:tRNA (guanine26-N2/guanine27-N2)-dimethyltransferase